MKHPHGIIVNDIIQQFNQVSVGVKTGKQVFFFFPFNRMIKKFERKRPPNVIFGNPMILLRRGEEAQPAPESNRRGAGRVLTLFKNSPWLLFCAPYTEAKAPGGILEPINASLFERIIVK
jgi:hypothetical protein